MSCFHPLSAYKDGLGKLRFGDPPVHTGPWSDFKNKQYEVFTVPCGICIGCRIDRSKQWALRCVLEAKSHENNCFLTLTYDDEHLPLNGSLDFDHLTKFLKRFRKKFDCEKIRYYAVGEYGAKLQRPHFHLIVFGFDFPDKWLWSCTRGQNLYRSPCLESLWRYGYSSVGAVSFESCAYVARYVQKKLYGGTKEDVLEHYNGKIPEAARMSRRPGIANDFFRKYHDDIYPKDFITFKGRKYKPGKYFDMLYKKEHPNEMLQVKVKRLEAALAKVDDCTQPLGEKNFHLMAGVIMRRYRSVKSFHKNRTSGWFRHGEIKTHT